MSERNALEMLEWRTKVGRAFRRYVKGLDDAVRDETLDELADLLGRGVATVKNWAEGETVPPAPAAEALERELVKRGISV